MSEKFDNFCSELRTKINDADKRIKDLESECRRCQREDQG